MTNKERYKSAFSVLQSSERIVMEERNMRKYKVKKVLTGIAAAAAAAGLVFGAGNVVTYAMEGTSLIKAVKIHFADGTEVKHDVEFEEIEFQGEKFYQGEVYESEETGEKFKIFYASDALPSEAECMEIDFGADDGSVTMNLNIPDNSPALIKYDYEDSADENSKETMEKEAESEILGILSGK